MGSNLPEGEGGALDPKTHKVCSAAAPKEEHVNPPPPPPPLLPEMEDALAVSNSIRALSPRLVAVHGPTGTGKSTVFPLAVAHWTYTTAGMKSGPTVRSRDESLLGNYATVCGRIER